VVSVSSTDRCWLRLGVTSTRHLTKAGFSILYGSLLAETSTRPGHLLSPPQFQYPLRIVVG